MQHAFVFIKPHANTEKMKAKVTEKFSEKGIEIVGEGDIKGTDIDEKKLIDQHYYAIASKATILEAKDIPVPKEKFKDTFGEDWDAVLADKRAFNALDLKKALGWSAEQLDAEWDKTSDKHDPKTRIKFGGGFYCGKIHVDGKDLYTFNAFFMTMRGKFTGDNNIHYYDVKFDPATLSWADFRGKVLGPTNPAEAPADSLRGIANADWQALGLPSAPNTGDNAVHASASPFEGLAERTNWLKDTYTLDNDPFAKVLTEAGLSQETMKAWSVDPQVKLAKDGDKKGSLFDQVEDMDLPDCVAKLKELSDAQA